jgi:hypothetical protein
MSNACGLPISHVSGLLHLRRPRLDAGVETTRPCQVIDRRSRPRSESIVVRSLCKRIDSWEHLPFVENGLTRENRASPSSLGLPRLRVLVLAIGRWDVRLTAAAVPFSLRAQTSHLGCARQICDYGSSLSPLTKKRLHVLVLQDLHGRLHGSVVLRDREKRPLRPGHDRARGCSCGSSGTWTAWPSAAVARHSHGRPACWSRRE